MTGKIKGFHFFFLITLSDFDIRMREGGGLISMIPAVFETRMSLHLKAGTDFNVQVNYRKTNIFSLLLFNFIYSLQF